MAVSNWVVPEPIYQFLATTGKGASTGGSNAIGNYSSTGGSSGESFIIQPPVGEKWRIERMMIHIQDTGSFDAEKYGNGVALGNGISVRVETDTGTVHDLTDGRPVVSNAQWARQCYDTRVDTYGIGDESLSARWTFSKGGYPLRLDGDLGQRLTVFIHDTCTGLNAHNFYVNGFKEDEAFDHRFLQ